MRTPAELPGELQDVEANLQAALRDGGIEACERLVNDLAAEAELGRAILDQADLSLIEIDEQIETFPEIANAATPRIKELENLQIAGRIAEVRYSYAAMRLQGLKYGV